MIDALAANSVIAAIGLALLHFLWQGTVIGLLSALALWALRGASAGARYAIGCLGLTAMLAAPIVTTLVTLAERSSVVVATETLTSAPPVEIGGRDAPTTTTPSPRWLPIVVLVWSMGVVLLASRLMGSWRRVRRIRRDATPLETSPWPDVVRALSQRLGVTRAVALLRSTAVDVPSVIGWLRPMIVVPASALAHLSPAELEAILAHELAHIRRGDYLVNALQCVVEILLFYHPAVWWVSRQIRREREHCCDDVAVTVATDRVTFANALATLEELQPKAPAFALRATGGDLLTRIRRLLHPEPPTHSKFSGGFVMAIAFGVLLVAVTVLDPVAQTMQPDRGRLVGSVRDQQGGVIPGATVSVSMPGETNPSTTVSNARGEFVIADLPAGPYELWVSLTGFRTAGVKARVQAGRDSVVIVDLQLGTLAETLTVAAAPPAPGMTTATPPRVQKGRDVPPTPIRVGGDITEPKKIFHVAPVYPPEAAAARVEGQVIIAATIGTDGTVTFARVVSSLPMLDEAALAAVRQWRFTPTLLNRVPMAVTMTVAVNFTLR